MQHKTHLRNLAIVLCTMGMVCFLAVLRHPAQANPLISPPASTLQQTVDATFAFDQNSVAVVAGGTIEVTANLATTSAVTTTVAFNIANNVASFPGWTAADNTGGAPVSIAPDQTVPIVFTLTAPANASGSILFQATATATTGETFAATITITIADPSPTPSNTPTATNTPLPPTDTPTSTPAPVDLQLLLRSGERERDATPGSNVTYQLRLVNNGQDRVTVDLFFDDNVRCSEDFAGCSQSFSGSTRGIGINPGGDFEFDVVISLPSDATIDETTDTRVIARATSAEGETSILLSMTIIEPTPTNTPTDTPTETPTNTPTDTPTETLGPVCTDDFENDNDIASARLILVNLPQPQEPIRQENNDRRAICPSGDEDWLFFGAVAGKVYTIDVRDVATGLDLSLELTDEDGNQLAFNDDYPDRDPVINPQIDSWRAPETALYYIRVRDITQNGGTNLTYRIAVQDESYGPTPSTVPEICADLYEPDGLSEQAPLITSNERQPDRRLCPQGDADWVTFFGKAGKRYFVYTDSRPYNESNPVNPETQAGADTVLTLTDRDGVTILDVNDDIPGGATLDSQIEFIPEVDGFYFIQVKNVGDIGNQFIAYDLTLQLCIPGQEDCGRDFSVPPTPTSIQPTEEPTATLTDEFDLDETETPTTEPETNPEEEGP